MLKKILTVLLGLSIGGGLLLMLGSVGAFDLNHIDFKSFLIQGVISVALVGIGFKGLKVIYPNLF